MLFSLIAMLVIAKILHSKGYSFEKMAPYLILVGIIGFFIPVGTILALPFKLVGSVLGAVFGGLGAALGGIGGALGGFIGGILGFVGGILGAVMGVVGAVVGLVFGAIGLAFGLVTLIGIPLLIVFLIVKLVR